MTQVLTYTFFNSFLNLVTSSFTAVDPPRRATSFSTDWIRWRWLVI